MECSSQRKVRGHEMSQVEKMLEEFSLDVDRKGCVQEAQQIQHVGS